MGDFQISGAEQFLRVSKALKEQGDKGLKRELNKQLKAAVQPMKSTVLEHIEQYLPSGYAPVMAGRLQVSTAQSARTGLRLAFYAQGRRKRRYIRAIDDGTLRHPVYGNREAWVNQRVKPGFVSDVLKESDVPFEAIQQAVRNTISKIT